MNGAESLVRTLVAEGVNICFTNPGTSEMHFVSALDRVPGMRCILGLFEGVVTGAADGYYRVAGKPAATLVHLGPGLGNGLANLHNAKKARSGIVNIVGEHASYHVEYDAPLTADIQGVAKPMSDWVKTATSSMTLAADAAEAIAVARQSPGKIATLIAPGDTAWGPAEAIAKAPASAAPKAANKDAVMAAVRAIQAGGGQCMLFLGGAAVRGRALELAGRIAAKTGCQILGEFSLSRQERGVGRVNLQRLPYPVDLALKVLSEVREMVLVGAKIPVASFAYPGKPSVLTAEGCRVTALAAVEDNLEASLEALASEVGALNVPPAQIATLLRPPVPTGAITPESIAAVLGAHMPENCIVVDESVTAGRGFSAATAGAPAHDWMGIMGGSIGFAMPNAIGAAVAAPDRKVIALEGDGSGMYTIQSLWTMARAGLNITVLVFANRCYQILRGEFARVGAGEPGVNATDMLTIDRPALDWVALAKAQGVEAGRANDMAELNRQFLRAMAAQGPYLIEVTM